MTRDDDEELTRADARRIERAGRRATSAILRHPMVTAREAAALLGVSASDVRAGLPGVSLIALPTDRGLVFPAFQFGPQPNGLVAELNRVLGSDVDPWGAASWWLTVDPLLGARPCELLADPGRADDLRRAAARETAPVE